MLASNYFIASELLKAQTGPFSPKARLTVDHTITTIFELTLGIDRDLSGLVGHDGLVVVEQQLAGVIVVAASEDGVGNLGAGVICLYRYFEIFLLVLISFPTAKSFLQRIFTPKKFLRPSGHKITYKSYISS